LKYEILGKNTDYIQVKAMLEMKEAQNVSHAFMVARFFGEERRGNFCSVTHSEGLAWFIAYLH